VLNIPRLRLTAPVFEGTGTTALNRGLGRIAGTAALGASGNLGIAGHRDGFFRALKDIEPGDLIQVRARGSQDIYEVASTRIVDRRDVNVLQPTSFPTLTLVTCYPFYFVGDAPERFVVKAALKQRTLRTAVPLAANTARSNRHEKAYDEIFSLLR
jgi:sortase A